VKQHEALSPALLDVVQRGALRQHGNASAQSDRLTAA
jgi:hypothetical protein